MERYGLDPTLHPEQEFKAELDEIISTPLTPENINTYATGALDQLINLAENVTNSYGHLPTISFETDKQTETAAFGFFKIGDVEAVLDHISEKAVEIDGLDDIIAQASTTDRVIIPTDPSGAIMPGEGSAPEKQTVPRLKTLLFILSNEFNIDLKDKSQVELLVGKVEAGMVRDESYTAVEAKAIDRTVLVCDERGNATYVFDAKKLIALGLAGDSITQLRKSGLNALLEQHPEVGRRIIYSTNFVPHVVKALYEPHNKSISPGDDKTGQYLHPRATPETLSFNGISQAFTVSRHTLEKVVAELIEAGSLAPPSTYRFRTNYATGFTSEDQQIIYTALEQRGLLLRPAPEGVLSINGLAKVFGTDRETVMRAVQQLEDEQLLGDTQDYKFGPTPGRGLTPQQQEMVRKALEEKGQFNFPPDGFISLNGLAKKLDVDYQTIVATAESLVEAKVLDSLKKYRFNHRKAALGLDSDQQSLVEEELKRRGVFLSAAPEGILSATGLAKILGADPETIIVAANKLADEQTLGETQTYRFGPKATRGFTPEQQQLITEFLAKN